VSDTANKTERTLACSECGTHISTAVVDALGFAIGSEMGCGACGERSVCVMPKSDTAATIGKWSPGDTPMWNGKAGRVVAGESPLDVCMKLMDIVAAQDATLDAITETLACDRGDVAEAVRLLVTAHEACKRERDESDDLAARHMAKSAGLRRANQQLAEGIVAHAQTEVEAIARAERAEAERDALTAKVERVRERARYSGGGMGYDVLEILDGKEGAR
jgi:hypothetical protein